MTFMCGDLFHIGHLNLLKRAKALGDTLVVGIASDYAIDVEPTKRFKSVFSSEERLRIIQSIKEVDFAFVYAENKDLEKSIQIIKPNVICRGDDWEDFPGRKQAEKQRIKIVYLPYTDGISSTILKDKIHEKSIRR